MGEWFDSVITSPELQFLAGVSALVFGSRAVLSEDNLKGKLWGLGAISRWLKRKQERTAQAELSELRALRETVAHQHEYIVHETARNRSLEIWAANAGYEIPPPEHLTLTEWLRRREEERE